MLKRDIPVILFALVFLVIAYGLITTPPRYAPVKPRMVMEEVEEFVPQSYYKGRVLMPDVDDQIGRAHV